MIHYIKIKYCQAVLVYKKEKEKKERKEKKENERERKRKKEKEREKKKERKERERERERKKKRKGERIIGPDNPTWYQLFKISNRDKERKEKKENKKVCVNVRACAMYVCMRLGVVPDVNHCDVKLLCLLDTLMHRDAAGA